jgi:Xaa-Pro aminopeptidase
MEFAACIKSADEIACVSLAVSVAETGIARMREALAPGITENELWSLLHRTNIEMGGEWSEYRLLASGPRTNPWGQECGDRIIRAGDLVAFDTGMVGPFGYDADVSRTLHCGPGKPSAEQRRLYRLAHENLTTNTELIRPGLGFRELAARAWPMPPEFVANRYAFIAHGVGMMNQYPAIYNAVDFERDGYDGIIEEGMTLSVESYIGADGGREGVKLEDQVLVTRDGCERLSTFPFEEALLA